MFRVVSGPGPELPTEHASFDRDAERGPGAGTPFVEVGGPEGVVTGAVPNTSPPRQVSRPSTSGWPQAVRTPVPPMPTIAPAPVASHTSSGEARYLSVTFHRIPKAGLRIMQSGVAPEIVAYHFPDHPVTAEYKQVREEIVRQFDDPGAKVALFTSGSTAAGTTTVLVNFAVSLTQEYGSRVLLVDANLARPGIARRLGCAETPGLAEVMGQSIPLAWALQPTPIANIHVLGAGTPTDITEEAMANDFPKLLTQLRQWFDWVIVDAGVWGDLPSSEATCANADAIYLVTRSSDIELPGFGGLRGDVYTAGGQVRGYISTRQ